MLRLLIAVGVLFGRMCHPAVAGVPKELPLQRGVATTLEGVVNPSDHDCYLLVAGLRDAVQIKLEAATNDGVVSVFSSGYIDCSYVDT